MIHRFATFEIDEATREVRAGGRALEMQPRVFDLLVYLARNRDRVVPKDELLEAVWPGVLVTDGSLQRAVSLARAALADAGAPDAIRTHSRQGYRFRADEVTASPEVNAPASADAARVAQTAYARGDWEGAIAAFKTIDELEGLSGDDLQRWAHAAQCAGRPREAIVPLERAVAAYSARGNRRHAAWAAILIAQLQVEWREPAPAHGWYRRAMRLLESEPACREKGYLALLGARMALLSNELESALELGTRARELGEQTGDPDLEGLALAHIGEASLFLGKVRDGLAAMDEAGASVVASGLSPWAGGLIFCGVIYTCISRADWHRATQWTEQFTRWCSDKGTAGYPGLCRLHCAEVLTIRGNLAEAESEARNTIDMLARQAPWAEGDAWGVLGEILLARGSFDEARRAFQQATELGWESQYGFALLHLAQGDADAAERLLGRSLRENAWSSRSRRGQALSHYIIAAAQSGKPDQAATALAELERDPDLTSTSALQALLMRARAELAMANGDRSGAMTSLRASVRAWQSIDAPLMASETRCRLACFLEQDGDKEAAARELAAAATVFRRAGAARLLARCDELRARLESGGEARTTGKKLPAART